MSKFGLSVQGYLNKLVMSKKPTLLLEGVYDVKALSALRARLETEWGQTAKSVYLDSTELISDSLGLVGARQTVEHVLKEALAQSLDTYGLVDREFNDFSLVPPIEDTSPRHTNPSTRLYMTRGHSIENYLFTFEWVDAYLHREAPAVLTPAVRQTLQSNFERIVRYAAAVSVAAQATGTLGKSKGLLGTAEWRTSAGGVLELDLAAVVAALVSRSVPNATAILFSQRASEVHTDIEKKSVNLARWLSQGHVLVNVLWSAVGHVLRSHGVQESEIHQCCVAAFDVRFRAGVDVWASNAAAGTEEFPADMSETVWGLKKPAATG